MKILSLNCQKGYNSGFNPFLRRILTTAEYDFLLLQEVPPEVAAYIESTTGAYAALSAFNNEVGCESMLRVLYRKAYVQEDSKYISFAKLHPFIHSRPEFGLLAGTFRAKEKEIVVGTIHFHPAFPLAVRRKELLLAKTYMQEYAGSHEALFAGDCNFGLSSELVHAQAITGPEYVMVTRDIPPTLDSRFSEPAPNPFNGTAVLLAQFGLGVKLKTDHFFLTKTVVEHSSVSCRVLPDRVSDHSPVELAIAGAS